MQEITAFPPVMTSNDSGVESSTDNDDCAPPPSPFPTDDAAQSVSSTIVAAATADAEMAVVPAPAVRKPREFPVSLCLNSGLSDRIVFARPVFSELPGRKFKCTFEFTNPVIPGAGDGGSVSGGGDRFQTVSTRDMWPPVDPRSAFRDRSDQRAPFGSSPCR